MQSISLTLDDGFRFEKAGEVVSLSGLIGGYRRVGDEEGFFYYTDLIEITETQKLEFEGRVREIIREVGLLEGKLCKIQ